MIKKVHLNFTVNRLRCNESIAKIVNRSWRWKSTDNFYRTVYVGIFSFKNIISYLLIFVLLSCNRCNKKTNYKIIFLEKTSLPRIRDNKILVLLFFEFSETKLYSECHEQFVLERKTDNNDKYYYYYYWYYYLITIYYIYIN